MINSLILMNKVYNILTNKKEVRDVTTKLQSANCHNEAVKKQKFKELDIFLFIYGGVWISSHLGHFPFLCFGKRKEKNINEKDFFYIFSRSRSSRHLVAEDH